MNTAYAVEIFGTASPTAMIRVRQAINAGIKAGM